VILPLANILQPLINVADSVIKFFHDDVGLSWGIAIIALTFTVRIAVLPLSLRGIRSMRRMQLVAPKIQALKEKYKDDPQRFQRETMELYKKEGVNPFSSCLPFILQIPFFIAIYQLLRGTTFQADVMASPPPGFLFVKSVIEAPQGAELIVLIVLFVTTTAASVLLTTATSPTASPAQRYLMLLFPLIIVPFIINAPAGLAVYWITTNLFSLGQQWIVNRVMPAPAPATAAAIKETKAPPPPPRKKKRKRR
jgi:YidC/Oxa1 family membrane protein insertase